MSTAYWLARAGISLAGWTPRSVRYGLSSAISSASYLGWRSKRLVTQQNMARVLGLPVRDPRVKRAAFLSWSNYGRTASDLIYFPHMNIDRVEEKLEDLTQGSNWREYAHQALAPGKGAVVATAHFGSWDLAGAIVAREFPLSAIAETFKDPGLNDLLQGHRRDKKIGIIPLGNAGRPVLQELRQNHMVAIVVDRPMTRETGVEVSFFGHKTYVPGGPAALALKGGATVIPGFVWYGHHHKFYMRAFPPVFPQPCQSPEERTAEIARLTQYIYNALEEMIREWPTQWFMFRPFWPAGEARQE
ncbi:MAG TPA: lysophospholipid acyltransferase family protein [Ktedonobacteraceae bacterium]|nr:lysophospholipid acyltransferase family protein [Ktedonobacteraceae bacterium]